MKVRIPVASPGLERADPVALVGAQAVDDVAPAVPVPTTTKSKTSSLGTNAYPRPTKGILVAMTVMVRTLASSGRLAM